VAASVSSPFAESSPYREIRLEALKFAVQQSLPREIATGVGDTIRINTRMGEGFLADQLAMSMTANVLAETLPPLILKDATPFTVPRFATWFDHFVATYRSRWWGRPLRRHVLRYVDEPHTHRTEVGVRTRWTYPRATTVLPGRDFGHVVLKADAMWNARDVTPW
jgi:hypothetical protein